MTTKARIKSSSDAHWYYPDGKPCFEVPRADGKGNRKTTIADARKLGLLPSVTTILQIIDRPELLAWKIEQAVLAVVTSPRLDGEQTDAFVHRVLNVDREQEQERNVAADMGKRIHDAIDMLMNNIPISDEIMPWVWPAFKAVEALGKMAYSEKAVVGEGYAGRSDLIQIQSPTRIVVWDWKTSKRIPEKESWPDHQLQLAAYARAVQVDMFKFANFEKLPNEVPEIHTANCYISTLECGKFAIMQNPPWYPVFTNGFQPLLAFWQWQKNYKPQ